MKSSREKAVVAAFFILRGVMILFAAFGVGPMSGSKVHAPMWIIGLAGVLFTSAGVVVIAPSQAIVRIAAGILVVGLSAIFAWVALFGEAQYFSGGLSIFSNATEVMIARVLFGLVAILGIAIAVNALLKTLRKGDP